METINHINIKEMNFDRLFKQISPEDIPDDVFTLVGKIFPVITAGNAKQYNSMTASGGGMGVLFKRPVTWIVLQTHRYTLELIEKQQTYTLSYFPHEYKKQVYFLGSKSGRDSKKMKEVALTSIQTPAGSLSYKEARLIIECKLRQLTTPKIDDFCTQEDKEYLNEMYKNPNEHRKFVFGEITHVWIKN